MPEPEHPRSRKGRGRAFAALALLAAALTLGWLLARDHRESTAAAAGAESSSADAGRISEATNASIAAGVARLPSPRARPRLQPGPLPPPEAPLAQTYSELKSRADAGDGAAAARLYHDVHECFAARQRLRMLPMAISAHAEHAPAAESTLGAEQLKQRDERLADMQRELDEAKREAAACQGLSEEQLRLVPAALTAARLGDKDASDCYVSGFLLFMGGILDHPEWLAQYKDNALAIANNALAAGDWTMVGELQRAYAPVGFNFGPLGDLVGQDPAMSYRLLRLRRLGATNEESAQFLERQIAAAAEGLPADAISDGDAWAQDTFNRYFSNAPADPGNHDMGCGM